MAKEFWVKGNDGVELGPFDTDKVKQLAANGMLQPTMMLSADRVNWRIAGQISALFPPRAPEVSASGPPPIPAIPSKSELHPKGDTPIPPAVAPVASPIIKDASVSQSWRRKFELLEKIGADSLGPYHIMASKEFKALPVRDRLAVGFNFLALLFGPFYYFAKKLWTKGAILLACYWVYASVLTFVEWMTGWTIPMAAYWAPSAVISAQLANYDVYRRHTQGETLWKGIPESFGTTPVLVGSLIGSIGLLLGVSYLQIQPEAQSSYTPPAEEHLAMFQQRMLQEVSGVWQCEKDGAILTIDLRGPAKIITVGQMRAAVEVKGVDLEAFEIALDAKIADGNRVSWNIRQIFSGEPGEFRIFFTAHNGASDRCGYVRDL